MKDATSLRKMLAAHLEAALAIAEELKESGIAYSVETALDSSGGGRRSARRKTLLAVSRVP